MRSRRCGTRTTKRRGSMNQDGGKIYFVAARVNDNYRTISFVAGTRQRLREGNSGVAVFTTRQTPAM
jgi:hypothetical protein